MAHRLAQRIVVVVDDDGGGTVVVSIVSLGATSSVVGTAWTGLDRFNVRSVTTVVSSSTGMACLSASVDTTTVSVALVETVVGVGGVLLGDTGVLLLLLVVVSVTLLLAELPAREMRSVPAVSTRGGGGGVVVVVATAVFLLVLLGTDFFKSAADACWRF